MRTKEETGGKGRGERRKDEGRVVAESEALLASERKDEGRVVAEC
jgi:hypothetical protein